MYEYNTNRIIRNKFKSSKEMCNKETYWLSYLYAFKYSSYIWLAPTRLETRTEESGVSAKISNSNC